MREEQTALMLCAALLYNGTPGTGPDRAKRAVDAAVELLDAAAAKVKELDGDRPAVTSREWPEGEPR